ncbi:MAG: universal stress protein [Chloroflexi bacterium]|nr:universal stress protein [Chloroflexota bacterium]
MSYSRIVVPLDGSPLAERALPVAASIAYQQAQPELLLVTVRARNATSQGRFEQPPDEIHSYLRWAATNTKIPPVIVRTHVLYGDPPVTIAKFALNEGANLIAMATHGRTGLARGVLGSVTDRVVHLSTVPVMVVRSHTPGPAVLEEMRLEHVIVPLDGSELAETALQTARALARSLEANLTLLRAVPAEATEAERDVATAYLERHASALRVSGIGTETVVALGPAAASIIRAAYHRPRSLIAMTTRGASGLVRLTRGSVTDGVVRHAPVPTIVIPPVGVLLGPAIH